MKSGRPPQWNPVAALGRDVWTDIVPVATKDRVVFPVVVRSRLKWLGETGTNLLAVLDADHSVELLPWDPNGAAVLNEVENAIDAATDDHKDLLTLAAMDRYVRLTVDEAGRSSLPGPLAVFLDAHIAGSVRLVMRNSRLWLWSERRWDEDRAKRIELLSQKVSSISAVTKPVVSSE